MLRRRLSARSIATAALAVAVAALLAACGGGDESAATTATTAATEAGGSGERAQVTFMLPIPVRTIATFPFNVAEAAGFYEEENLEGETLTADSAAFAIQQMAAGKVDIALSTAGAALNAFAQEQPVMAVCEFFQGQVFSIWVQSDSSIQTFEDLRNKRIGVESMQGGHIPELKAFLAASGLTPGKDVTLVPLGDDAATVIAAFEQGKVDAYDLSFAFNPGPRLALDLRSVPSPEQLGQTAQEPLLVRRQLLEEQPDVVARFLRAIAKAVVFGNANSEAVFSIQRKVFPPELESMEFARLLLETSLQTMAGEEKLDPDSEFCRMPVEGWEELMNQLVVPGDPGAIQEKFDVGPYVDNSLVDQINDFDRQEVIDKAETFVAP